MCCAGKKRAKEKMKKYKKGSIWRDNQVHPMSNEKVNNEYIDLFRREVIFCGCCNQKFNLGSNELKIHCNTCEKFYHCGIAGECIGKDCSIITPDGSVHRASYCRGCAQKNYSNNTCICKDCAKN